MVFVASQLIVVMNQHLVMHRLHSDVLTTLVQLTLLSAQPAHLVVPNFHSSAQTKRPVLQLHLLVMSSKHAQKALSSVHLVIVCQRNNVHPFQTVHHPSLSSVSTLNVLQTRAHVNLQIAPSPHVQHLNQFAAVLAPVSRTPSCAQH